MTARTPKPGCLLKLRARLVREIAQVDGELLALGWTKAQPQPNPLTPPQAMVAAAPEMLELLKDSARNMSSLRLANPGLALWSSPGGKPAPWEAAILALVAKAEGR